MPILTTAAAILGSAATAIGTTATAIGATTGTIGTVISAAGTAGSLYANAQGSEASKRAEALRKQQLELDNRRRVMSLLREAQANRSRAITSATANGLIQSSALEGGLGSIGTQNASNVNAQFENYSIGSQIFDANAQYSEARAMSTNFGAVTDFGKSLFTNSERIGRIGETLFNSQG